jgi:hypothetical protein
MFCLSFDTNSDTALVQLAHQLARTEMQWLSNAVARVEIVRHGQLERVWTAFLL